MKGALLITALIIVGAWVTYCTADYTGGVLKEWPH